MEIQNVTSLLLIYVFCKSYNLIDVLWNDGEYTIIFMKLIEVQSMRSYILVYVMGTVCYEV